MARKPASLIYGVADRPPWPALFLLTLQHIFLMSSTLVLPVVLIKEIGSSAGQVHAVVGLTMIACGIGTILQAVRWGPVGSGYLCPNLCGPNFFAASASAAWLGGLPLLRGMTIAAGLVEIVFARGLRRLRSLFPPEITGLVVLMVAVSLVPLGTSKFLGINYAGDPISPRTLATAVGTLLVLIGANVWSRGPLRLYSVLLGLISGYILAGALGLITAGECREVAAAPWLALPALDGITHVSFRWSLLPTFVIVSICGALKSFGNLIMCEMVNDEEWKEPDMKNVSNGLVADGLCVTVSGLIGGMASDTSASNVALSSASGATSRRIAYTAGALFAALGFSPKLTSVLSIMPMPVMGAILVYVTSFMIVSGFKIIQSARPDAKITFVIGVSFIFGLSLDGLPVLYSGIKPWLRPLFESPLTLTVVLAVLLNQILRADIRKNPHGKTG